MEENLRKEKMNLLYDIHDRMLLNGIKSKHVIVYWNEFDIDHMQLDFQTKIDESKIPEGIDVHRTVKIGSVYLHFCLSPRERPMEVFEIQNL